MRPSPCPRICAALLILLAPLGAQALSLGDLHVSSRLHQPLDASIDIPFYRPNELKGLTLRLAANDVFQRAGVVKSAQTADLRFRLRFRDGKPFVHVTSPRDMMDPVVSFFIEASWTNGRIIRAYDLLLDPPDTQVQRAEAQKIAQATVALPVEQQMGDEVIQRAETQASPRRGLSPDRAAPVNMATSDGSLVYGPTRRGDTLSQIAQKIRPQRNMSLPQVMMALFKQNPDAFEKGNINGLMAGHQLKLEPSTITQMSRREAQQWVEQQSDQWRAPRTRVATSDADVKVLSPEHLVASGKIDVAKLEILEPGAGEQIAEEMAALESELTSTRSYLALLRKENEDLKGRMDAMQAEINRAMQQLTSSVPMDQRQSILNIQDEAPETAVSTSTLDNITAGGRLLIVGLIILLCWFLFSSFRGGKRPQWATPLKDLLSFEEKRDSLF